MSEAPTLTAGVAGRYAAALFDLAKESDILDDVSSDLGSLKAAIADSADFRRLIESPLYGRDDQGRAMAEIATRMGLGETVTNLLGLMARKRRLFVLPKAIDLFAEMLAEHRGEVTATVTSARYLSDPQIAALKSTLSERLGREVKLDIFIDPAIIGGLIVKVGSRMIDTSIRSKLANLKTAMREAG